MQVLLSLLELQRRFLGGLCDSMETGPIDQIVAAGLEPAARFRIYRHNTEQNHLEALRTTYPAVSALVGDAFFEQTAARYRSTHPSRSGNLQAFGDHFSEFLTSLQNTQQLPYLSDVAQLEWLRRRATLAAEAKPLTLAEVDSMLAKVDGPVRMILHPSMQRLVSPHPVLTIWQYAIHPSSEHLTLPESGERVVLWRSEDEVAMAGVDVASFACIDALAHGESLDKAHALANDQDPAFNLPACITSLIQEGLITAILPIQHGEN